MLLQKAQSQHITVIYHTPLPLSQKKIHTIVYINKSQHQKRYSIFIKQKSIQRYPTSLYLIHHHIPSDPIHLWSPFLTSCFLPLFFRGQNRAEPPHGAVARPSAPRLRPPSEWSRCFGLRGRPDPWHAASEPAASGPKLWGRTTAGKPNQKNARRWGRGFANDDDIYIYIREYVHRKKMIHTYRTNETNMYIQ